MKFLILILTMGVASTVGVGCSRGKEEKPAADTQPQAAPCREITGKAWVPVKKLDPDEENPSSFQFVTEKFHFSAPVVGAIQGFSAAETVSFEFEMQEPLGAGGELSLTAHVPVSAQETTQDFRSDTVHPLLISLWDGKHEWVGMDAHEDADRADPMNADDCHSNGILKVLEDGNVVTRSGCVPVSKNGSAFFKPSHWFDKQFSIFGGVSFNQFPTCDWKLEGAPCTFNERLFQSEHELRSGNGVKYRATYLVLSSALAKVGSEVRASLDVTVQKKITDLEVRRANELPQDGHFDLNIILVGQSNIQASRTEAGQKALQDLLVQVQETYHQPHVRIQLGNLQVFEWQCNNGGEAFANLKLEELGKFFETGSSLIAQPGIQHPALNLFLVESLTAGDENSPLTVQGLAGGIGGPPVPGTRSSGVVIPTHGFLTKPTTNRSPLESLQLSDTLTHEIGHFLGLSHLSERNGKTHDPIPDTPECHETERIYEMDLITDRSCKKDRTPLLTTGKNCAELCQVGSGKKCPEVEECAFNHVMWWVSKDYHLVSGRVEGDGHLFSSLSGRLLRYSPFVY